MNLTHLVRTTVVFSLAVCLQTGLFAADEAAAPELKIKVGNSRVKSFGESPTIIVPTVYLKLPVSGKVFVAKQGGALSVIGGGSANSVKASARYSVEGLDKEFAQKLAAKVEEDFVSRLRAAGFTVKTHADLKDSEVMQKAQTEKVDDEIGLPLEKDPSGNVLFAVASPSDAQNFKSGMVGGVFNQFIRRGKSTLGEGTIIIPTYTIAAPQAWGETGSGFKRISASVNVAPGMNLTHAIASVLTEKGGWGDVHTSEQLINIGEKVGELGERDTTDKAGNAFSSALSGLTGAGKISSKSAEYQLKIDQAAYEAGLLRGTGLFNAEVAEAAARARK